MASGKSSACSRCGTAISDTTTTEKHQRGWANDAHGRLTCSECTPAAFARQTPLTRSNSVGVTSRLPAETVAKIDALAALRGTTRNQIINAVLALGLEDYEASDAAKIPNPDARARFVASRLARKTKRLQEAARKAKR